MTDPARKMDFTGARMPEPTADLFDQLESMAAIVFEQHFGALLDGKDPLLVRECYREIGKKVYGIVGVYGGAVGHPVVTPEEKASIAVKEDFLKECGVDVKKLNINGVRPNDDGKARKKGA